MYVYIKIRSLALYLKRLLHLMHISSENLVSRSQTAFSVFICGGGKKGLVSFTDASRLDTFECVNKLHH